MMKRGLSEVIGMLIFLVIIIAIVVPVAMIMLSQPTIQQQQIESVLPYRNLAQEQYNDFQPIQIESPLFSSSRSSLLVQPVYLVYNESANTIGFIFTSNSSLPIPLIVKYLSVFNGSQWVILNISHQGNKWWAKVTDSIPSGGVLIAPNESNAEISIRENLIYEGLKIIQIQLPVQPYDGQPSFVSVVTQYGNVIYATSFSKILHALFPFNITSGLYGVTLVNLQLTKWISSSAQGFYESFYNNFLPITINTTSGYLIYVEEILFNFTASYPGLLSITLEKNPWISDATLTIENETLPIYPYSLPFNITPGSYNASIHLMFKKPILYPFTLVGVINYTVLQPGLNNVYFYNFYVHINPLKGNVLDLLNGYLDFYVPHIYEGVSGLNINTSIVKFFDYLTAPSGYWKKNNITQPVLQLVCPIPNSQGLIFWPEYYESGENVTITFIGSFYTYNYRWAGAGDGFEVYLFLNPTKWNVSPEWNYSTDFPLYIVWPGYPYSLTQGNVVLPQSNTTFLYVQMDPVWGYSPWNIWVVNSTKNITRPINPYSCPPTPPAVVAEKYKPILIEDHYGSGVVSMVPLTYIYEQVTYDPQTNTIYAVAFDLNTGQYTIAVLNLGKYFSPPPSGYYVFGIGADGGSDFANWGLLYANYTVW